MLKFGGVLSLHGTFGQFALGATRFVTRFGFLKFSVFLGMIDLGHTSKASHQRQAQGLP